MPSGPRHSPPAPLLLERQFDKFSHILSLCLLSALVPSEVALGVRRSFLQHRLFLWGPPPYYQKISVASLANPSASAVDDLRAFRSAIPARPFLVVPR